MLIRLNTPTKVDIKGIDTEYMFITGTQLIIHLML